MFILSRFERGPRSPDMTKEFKNVEVADVRLKKAPALLAGNPYPCAPVFFSACKQLLGTLPYTRFSASSSRNKRSVRTCNPEDGNYLSNKAWCARRQNGEPSFCSISKKVSHTRLIKRAVRTILFCITSMLGIFKLFICIHCREII